MSSRFPLILDLDGGVLPLPQAQTLALLKDLQRDCGTAVLFITHDMGVVAEVADDVLVMRSGRVVESGSVHDVFSNPRDPYNRSLIEAVPGVAGIRSDATITAVPIDGLPRPRPDQASVLDVANLSVRFPVHGGMLGRCTGVVHAVEDVSFSIERGETLGLVASLIHI